MLMSKLDEEGQIIIINNIKKVRLGGCCDGPPLPLAIGVIRSPSNFGYWVWP